MLDETHKTLENIGVKTHTTHSFNYECESMSVIWVSLKRVGFIAELDSSNRLLGFALCGLRDLLAWKDAWGYSVGRD